jgi:hypothetical protein
LFQGNARDQQIAGRHWADQSGPCRLTAVNARAWTDHDNAILSYVGDSSATLIVMGGYGQTKLREVILGGVTREMLKSMTVPVFMSH